jgi:hypothetical protein
MLNKMGIDRLTLRVKGGWDCRQLPSNLFGGLKRAPDISQYSRTVGSMRTPLGKQKNNTHPWSFSWQKTQDFTILQMRA